MASFRKLPSGLWQATVFLPSKKRISRTDPLKKVVVAWATDTEAQIRRGKWRDPRAQTTTIGQWHSVWEPTRTVEYETARADEGSWRLHLKDTFADMRLIDLNKIDVEAWVKERLEAGIGRSAIRRALNFLKALIEAAVENDLIEKNVARRVPTPEKPKGPPRWFTRAEVDKITAAMRSEDKKWVPMAVMTEVMVWGGLRWGEAAALFPEDIDWARSKIIVTHNLMQSGKDKPYPKNSASVGEVPIPKWLLENLQSLAKDLPPGQRLFTTRRQARNLTGANWRKDWDAMLVKAKVKPGTPHVCGHTCASWLVQAGVSLYEVRRHLRHASMKTTEIYAHLAPDEHASVINAWGIFSA